MIANDINISSIIIKDKPEPCIFCLEDEPPPIFYQGVCKCHPPIHNSCINEWYKINPNSCPICLRGAEKTDNLIIIVEPRHTSAILLLLCGTCCFGICCSPFIIIAIVFAIYPLHRSNQVFTNTTVGN
jgi:hypothetical protein